MAQNAGNPGQPAAHAGAMPANHAAMAARRMPTLQEMKQMADKQAAPLLEKLKTNLKDSATLAQVGAIYHATHQFKEAAEYYRRAAEADPKNVALRTKLAISLYREGDVDQAIDQLSQALKQDPKDADALFNLGFIKLQGKQDSKGAIAAWQRLLKSNPQMSEDRKAEVQKLMAAVLTNMANQQPVQEAGGHESTK
jgi:cytochrome c-type biogenesis protein CcmH/NrfG